MTEKQLVRLVVEPPDNVAFVSVSLHSAGILGQSALPAAVHRCDREALGDPGELVHPVAAIARITVKEEYGRVGISAALWTEVLRMNPGSAYTSEREMERVRASALPV